MTPEQEAMRHVRGLVHLRHVKPHELTPEDVRALMLLAAAYVREHTWTKEPPTEEGFYWWREWHGVRPNLVQVNAVPATDVGGEWCRVTRPE